MLKRKLQLINDADTPLDLSVKHKADEDSQSTEFGRRTSDTITSKYFPSNHSIHHHPSFSVDLLWLQFYRIECRLNESLQSFRLTNTPTIVATYNPIDYASDLHCQYLHRFLHSRPKVLFVGMNPGPWGMCQTGVLNRSLPFTN